MNIKKYSALFLSACGLLALSILITKSNSPLIKSMETFHVLKSHDFATYITEHAAVVIDVRTPEEFATGHLSNAINIDSTAADFRQQLTALDKSKKYAIYCRSGNRSANALEIMRIMSFTSVVDLEGGIVAWERNHFPTCTDSLTCSD